MIQAYPLSILTNFNTITSELVLKQDIVKSLALTFTFVLFGGRFYPKELQFQAFLLATWLMSLRL